MQKSAVSFSSGLNFFTSNQVYTLRYAKIISHGNHGKYTEKYNGVWNNTELHGEVRADARILKNVSQRFTKECTKFHKECDYIWYSFVNLSAFVFVNPDSYRDCVTCISGSSNVRVERLRSPTSYNTPSPPVSILSGL